LSTGGDRQQKIEDARYKIEESEFFLGKLKSYDSSPRLEASQEFQYYFSAFLSAARSPLQILCLGYGWQWVDRWIASASPVDQELYRVFRTLRNISVHFRKIGPSIEVEMVPDSEVRADPSLRRSGGFIYMPRMAGTPPTAIRVTQYNLKIRGTDEKATVCCEAYLDLVRRLVDHREQIQSW